MRILLDEDLPTGLLTHLSPHEAEHVAQRGWQGKSNGDLLRSAVEAGFDVLITGDTHLPYQQDLRDHDIAVIEVRPARSVLRDLIELAPALMGAIKRRRGDR